MPAKPKVHKGDKGRRRMPGAIARAARAPSIILQRHWVINGKGSDLIEVTNDAESRAVTAPLIDCLGRNTKLI